MQHTASGPHFDMCLHPASLLTGSITVPHLNHPLTERGCLHTERWIRCAVTGHERMAWHGEKGCSLARLLACSFAWLRPKRRYAVQHYSLPQCLTSSCALPSVLPARCNLMHHHLSWFHTLYAAPHRHTLAPSRPPRPQQQRHAPRLHVMLPAYGVALRPVRALQHAQLQARRAPGGLFAQR